MSLPEGQDALITAVARANPNTVVVLETGNPVAMPWLQDVNAVLEAWYPGEQGGAAIAAALVGETKRICVGQVHTRQANQSLWSNANAIDL
jgi:beta-glucosidase